MKILQVTQVTVIKHGEPPMLCIQASGLAATPGWTNPRLDNSADPTPGDAVLEFSFDADRPTDIVPQVLSPISASISITPDNGADAVIVTARTNSLTVHASEFRTASADPAPITTLALGEEDPVVSTRALGEEGPVASTRALGEEDFTTLALGEESPVTTLAVGEEEPGGPFGRY